MKVLMAYDRAAATSLARTYTAPEDAKPAVGFLSNGSYTVMVTASGGGHSTRNGMAVSRWREDTVCDSWRSFCYLRDVRSGAVWYEEICKPLTNRKFTG